MVGGDFLYQVGDKIVYPLHGAGIVEAIEKREVLGVMNNYCIIKMPIGDVKIMIPMGKMENVGIRRIVNAETMESVLRIFRVHSSGSSVSWNQRYRLNMDKMKSGDIYKGAEVIRDLIQVHKEKGLGAGDKKMLDNAMQILISEFVLVMDISEEKAADMLNQVAYS